MESTIITNEEDILKFYYCESGDDYYIGYRVGNFYYARWDKETNCFIHRMSRYLPWGETIVDPKTLWKECTYPSKPVEISFNAWLEGFLKKYFLPVDKTINDMWKNLHKESEIAEKEYMDDPKLDYYNWMNYRLPLQVGFDIALKTIVEAAENIESTESEVINGRY